MNDEAREAFLERMGYDYLGDEAATEAWNACMAHLRATGQLCTTEERRILQAMARAEIDKVWSRERFARVGGDEEVCRLELARRAKGGPDVG